MVFATFNLSPIARHSQYCYNRAALSLCPIDDELKAQLMDFVDTDSLMRKRPR